LVPKRKFAYECAFERIGTCQVNNDSNRLTELSNVMIKRLAEAPPVAPSARRMPISRVRRATTKDITPYRPINESSSASVPKPLESAASRRSVVREGLT
jgi:hypothetical protein